MGDYYDDIILDMNHNIHWSAREAGNFLEDHPDINTFVIINENPEKQIDYFTTSFDCVIKKFDNIFTADIINEYKSRLHHIIHLYGTIGYSADTEDVEFIYDKKTNKIYVYGKYRILGCNDNEYQLFKDSFEMNYDKYWTLDNGTIINKLKEINVDEKYDKIDTEFIPYYRYPRTKDGLTIPRIIYNVFKIFSNQFISKEDKPKIIIPYYFNHYKRVVKNN